EYSPRALLTDEPEHIITPPANGGNWDSPTAFTANNYTAYTYDRMGRLLTKTEHYRPTYSSPVRALAAETNTYDKNGNLLTIKDALNNTATYTYDNAGRVTKVSNVLGQETQSSYDGLGRLIQQTDARGVTTQYIYDLFGNVLEQSVNGVTMQSTIYDCLGQPSHKTDANGNTTGYTYTLLGQQRSVTNADGYIVRYWYDEMGNNRRSLGYLGEEVINNYDGWNRLLSVTQQSMGGGNAISRSTRYDVLGNPVYEVDERGNTTQYTYDKLSRLISVKNPLGQTSTITYDANGNKVAETNWRGNTTTYRYDILDRLIGIIDPTGAQVETLTYTDNHRQATSTDALGHTTGFSYDNLGQLIATTDPEGYTSSQTYDAVGNIISKTDGNGNTTYYTYDNIRRLTNVVDAYGYMTIFGYDAVGNVLTQTNGLGCTTRYLYDHMNRPVLRSDPGGMANDGKNTVIDESRIERFTYDPYGNLSSRKDKNGIITTNTYDIHGRKTRENVNGAITGYQYDNSGNLLSVEDAGGAIVRTYDALNRTTSKTVPTFGTTTFNYDITDGLIQGQIGESTTIDGRTTTRVYDKTGRLAQVKDGSDTTNYTYYANGSLQTQTLPNGVTANYTYYNNNKLHTLENKKGSLTLEAYQYAYDGAGNMTAKQDVKGTTVYTYTPLNQLATVNEPNPRPSGPPPSEEGGNGKLTTYTYDAAGNRRSETVTTPPASFAGTPLASEGGEGQSVTTSYTVNEQNRLMHTEQTLNAQTIIEQYFYDDAGNMLGRRPEAFSDISEESPTGSLGLSLLGQMEENDMTPALYSYNDKNQMVEAINGSSTVTNTFNAEGLRDSKTVGDVTTYYCYEYSRIIKELDSEGSEAYNTYGTNLISRELDGEKVYYIYNGHGDVTGLISASGTVIASYYYDAFGNILENNGNFGNPYRYAGYMYDEESHLYNLNARFYDAKLARFMQEDTYLGSQSDPLSLNLYAYCNNNPLIYWDPTGHSVSGRLLDYMYGLGYDYKEGPGGGAIWEKRDKVKDDYSNAVWNRYGEVIGYNPYGGSYTDYSNKATNTYGGSAYFNQPWYTDYYTGYTDDGLWLNGKLNKMSDIIVEPVTGVTAARFNGNINSYPVPIISPATMYSVTIGGVTRYIPKSELKNVNGKWVPTDSAIKKWFGFDPLGGYVMLDYIADKNVGMDCELSFIGHTDNVNCTVTMKDPILNTVVRRVYSCGEVTLIHGRPVIHSGYLLMDFEGVGDLTKEDLTHQAGDLFDSQNHAALAFGLMYLEESTERTTKYPDGREIFALIYENGDKYYFNNIVRGEKDRVNVPDPDTNKKCVAWVHTHGAYTGSNDAGSDLFTAYYGQYEGDASISAYLSGETKRAIYAYLITPGGVIKGYNWSTHKDIPNTYDDPNIITGTIPDYYGVSVIYQGLPR
ncbi:MAG: DUF4329 domain-containing protein, partial [Clostridiales bacterium]|nr:DUF4329 domain-containing protein [Clostridiales bacterium]